MIKNLHYLFQKDESRDFYPQGYKSLATNESDHIKAYILVLFKSKA